LSFYVVTFVFFFCQARILALMSERVRDMVEKLWDDIIIRKKKAKKNSFILTYEIVICFLDKLNKTLKA